MTSFFIFVLAFGAIALRNAIKKANTAVPKDGLHAQMDTRSRRSRRSAAPYRASRLPPPPSGRPSSLPPPPPAPDAEPLFRTPDPDDLDQPLGEIDVEPETPEPAPVDESVFRTPDPVELDEQVEDTEPEPDAALTSEAPAEPEAAAPAEAEAHPEPDTSLDLLTVIRAVFGDDGSTRERAERFESDYAGRRVSWTAQALRSFTTRRDRIQVERVELFLGHTTDEERFSDRVMAEAFFTEGTEIERDTDITFTATLAEANVYARRLVLDGAEII